MTRPAPTLPVGVLAVAAAACVLAPVLTLLDIHSPLRVAAAFILFALAPGAALLPWLRSPRAGGAAEPALVLAVSLAASLLVTQAMLWLRAWSPATTACLFAAACLVSLAAQLTIRLRGAR